MSINVQKDANIHGYFLIYKVLHLFRLVSPHFIRITSNCIYSIWYKLTVVATCRYSYFTSNCIHSIWYKSTVVATCRYSYFTSNCIYSIWYNQALLLPVDTVICAPDNGCRDQRKHVQQFIGKINCV